jgi:hypothetical protein
MLKALHRKKEINEESHGASFRFILGYRHKTGKLDTFPESVSHIHGNGNVSLWKTKQELDDYLKMKAENDAYFERERQKGLIDDWKISQTIPHPELKNCFYTVVKPDPERIEALISREKSRILDAYGIIPRKEVFIPYSNVVGDYVAVLMVTWR